jgi:hypothetical protein
MQSLPRFGDLAHGFFGGLEIRKELIGGYEFVDAADADIVCADGHSVSYD